MIYWIAENILGGTSMDVFVEQIVKKRNTTKDIAVIVGIILAALIVFGGRYNFRRVLADFQHES